MPTPGGKAGKLFETLLPALLAVAALFLAVPPWDVGAEAQSDPTAATNCSGHAGYAGEAKAAPQQYCPGGADAGVPPRSDDGYPGQPRHPQYPPPSQYPQPQPEPAGVVVDLDGNGRPESNVMVADSDGDGVVDDEDVSAVVGDVFFVYAADGASSSVGSATPNATPEASGEGGDVALTPEASDEGGVTSDSDELEDGQSRAQTAAGDAGEDASEEASGEETRGPGEGTVADAERAAASGEPPGERGPGGIALFALGAATLLVANGLLVRWIVG